MEYSCLRLQAQGWTEHQEGRECRPSHLLAQSHPSTQGVFYKYRSNHHTRVACSVRCFLLKFHTSTGCYSAPGESLLCYLLRLDMSHSLLQLFCQQIQQLCTRELKRGRGELQVTNDKTIGFSIWFTDIHLHDCTRADFRIWKCTCRVQKASLGCCIKIINFMLL